MYAFNSPDNRDRDRHPVVRIVRDEYSASRAIAEQLPMRAYYDIRDRW